MEKEEGRQERKENIVQIMIIAVGFVIAALFLIPFCSASPIQVYNVENNGTFSEAGFEKAVEKEGSDGDDWEDSSDWLAEASDGTVSEIEPSSAAVSPSGSREQEVLVEKSIDINRAGQDELDRLPGIGPVLAGRIIQYREENGGFSDIEELKSVDGIGDKTFEKVRDYVIAG